MRQRYTFTKAEKLKSRKRIEWVFKEGKSLSVFPFKVFYLLVPSPAVPPAGPAASATPTPPARPAASAARTAPADPAAPLVAAPLVDPATSLAGPAPPLAPAALQAGFGAGSRHFKKAVDRNRIKRLSRETYRLQKQPLMDALTEKGRSLSLFLIYTGKELPDHATVKAKIGVLLQKLIKEVK